jgi:hypothetical protein
MGCSCRTTPVRYRGPLGASARLSAGKCPPRRWQGRGFGRGAQRDRFCAYLRSCRDCCDLSSSSSPSRDWLQVTGTSSPRWSSRMSLVSTAQNMNSARNGAVSGHFADIA